MSRSDSETGAVNRKNPDGDGDSYVSTEDHYIDYLTRTELVNLVPVTLRRGGAKVTLGFLATGCATGTCA